MIQMSYMNKEINITAETIQKMQQNDGIRTAGNSGHNPVPGTNQPLPFYKIFNATQ